MKIAFVCNSIPNNVNTTRFQRIKALSSDHSIYLITMEEVSPPIKDLVEETYSCPASSTSLSLPIFPFWAAFRLLFLSIIESISIVYTSRRSFSLVLGFLFSRGRIKWVADLWDDPRLNLDNHRGRGGIKYKLASFFEYPFFQIARVTLRYVDLLVLGTSGDLLDYYNVDDDRCLKLTNGVDYDYTRLIGNKNLTDEHSLTHTEKARVCYVGAISKERGIGVLFDTVELLAETEQYKFTLIGDPPSTSDRYWLQEELTASGETVEWTGKLDHKTTLKTLSCCDLCVNPIIPNVRNYKFAYPIKLLEYMALGKPIISSRTRGISEIITDGVDGLLVEPGNPDELAKAIMKLSQNQDFRYKLSRNATTTATGYDWSKINSDLIEKIKDI